MKTFLSLSIFLLLNSFNIFAQWQPGVRLSDFPFSSRTNLHNARNVAVDGIMVHVVWEDFRAGASGEVYYKHSTDKGVNWGADTRLTNNIGHSVQANVAASDQVVHVVWRDSHEGNPEVYYKRSTDGGISWGAEIRFSNSSKGTRYPTIAVSGQIVHVVYDDERHGGTEIYYRRSTDQGASWGAETRLTNVLGASYLSSVAVSGQNVHITWEDSRDYPFREIYYKRSTDGGVSWGADTRLTNDPAKSYFSSVAVSDQLVHVVWNDERDGNMEIYYKRSEDGGLNWGADTRLTNNSTPSEMACVTALGQDVHLVWQGVEIMYKRSTDGGINWESEIQLSTSGFLSWHPSVAAADSVVHAVWEDYRDGSSMEIYYASNPTGGTTGVENIGSEFPSEFILEQNYPNPFNPSTRIQYQVSSNTQVLLKVYDVLGNEVATLVDEFREAGRYEIELDANELSSGVYFYKLQAGSFVETKKMLFLK